jgi:ABC-type phosphate/phosphonate transport system permease subunit
MGHKVVRQTLETVVMAVQGVVLLMLMQTILAVLVTRQAHLHLKEIMGVALLL